MNRLLNIVSNKTVALVLHGKSTQELENNIDKFKNLDIIWVSLGIFDTIEEHILRKIDKELNIVFDTASIPESKVEKYELNIRIPRLRKFLSRNSNNLWITSHGLIRDSIFRTNQRNFYERFKHKILIADELFPKGQIQKYFDVPNSTTLFIGVLLCGGARKIFTFGLDGYRGSLRDGINCYYKPEAIRREREVILDSIEDEGMNRDTELFIKNFSKCIESYRKLFSNRCPIYNCSANSLYEYPKKINYDQLLKDLKNDNNV